MTQPRDILVIVLDIDLEDLREWAESHDPQDVAGYAEMPDTCPLANYLRDRGFTAPSVAYYSARVNGEGVSLDEPARLFVRRVDRVARNRQGAQSEAIRFLDVLGAIRYVKHQLDADGGAC